MFSDNKLMLFVEFVECTHNLHMSISLMCLKCKTEVGTLTHCLWSCKKLQRYWFLVLGKWKRSFNMQLDFDPVSLVLGIPNNCIVSLLMNE